MRDFAIVTFARPNPSFPGSKIVEVSCPWCFKTHVHGIPGGSLGGEGTDYRASDCLQGGDYLITDPNGVLK